MANEITEIGQIALYGGPQLTLLGSGLAGLVNSILIRQGTGAARTWRVFDPTKADALNTYKILNPGDLVLVNAKAVPMDFQPPPTGASSLPISWPVFTEPGSGPTTELDGLVDVSQAYVPSFAFATGAGTLQMQLNGSGTWVTAGPVTQGTTAQFQILNAAPFSGTLTLTPQ